MRCSSTSTLNGVFEAGYSEKIVDLVQNYNVVVRPANFKQLMEDSMGTLDRDCEAKCVEETPMQRALNQHKFQIKQLRESIARKQMELKIELARYTAVKKLATKGTN